MRVSATFNIRRIELSILVRVHVLGSVTAVEALKAMRVHTSSVIEHMARQGHIVRHQTYCVYQQLLMSSFASYFCVSTE